MIGQDLARLYGVSTKALIQAVKRNRKRFPLDFVFQLDARETRAWMTASIASTPSLKMGLRKPPYAFTEHGVAMLSGVLNSDRAIRANIAIMREFVHTRRVIAANRRLAERMARAERRLASHEMTLGEHAEALRAIFSDVRALIAPPKKKPRAIGFSPDSPQR